MSVYLVAKLKIQNRETYSQYEAGFMEIFNRYSGKLLSVEEAPEILEGDWAVTRTALIEFPSRDDAMSWWHSEEYQALAQYRRDASDGNIVMLDGLPQPI